MILSYHAMFIDENSGLYGVGSNTYGQLGINTETTSFSKEQKKIMDSVRQVATGLNHTIVLTMDNRVMTFGDNSKGQLGWSNTHSIESGYSPAYVTFPENVNIISIDAGLNHNVALDSKGDVWLWGDNTYGQCGVLNDSRVTGVNDIVYVPKKVVFSSLNKYSDRNIYTPVTELSNSDFTSSMNRGIYSVEASLEGAGVDFDGNSYDGANVYEVACGNNFTLIRKNNNVWAAGSNLHHQFTDNLGYATHQWVLMNEFLPNSGDKYDSDTIINTAIAGDNYIALLTKSKKVYVVGKLVMKDVNGYDVVKYSKMQRFKTDVNKLHYSPRGLLMNRRPIGATYDEVSELELDMTKGLFDTRNVIIEDIEFDINLDFPVLDFSIGIKYDIFVNGWKYLGTESTTFSNITDTMYTLDNENYGRTGTLGTIVDNGSDITIS